MKFILREINELGLENYIRMETIVEYLLDEAEFYFVILILTRVIFSVV